MSDQKSPREFGISNTMSGYRVVDKAPFDGCQFHVIEKSAYDAEVALKKDVVNIWQKDLLELRGTIGQLRADLDLAIEALKNTGCNQLVTLGAKCRPLQSNKCIRCETLAKLQGEKK